PFAFTQKKVRYLFEPASILRLHNRDHAGTLVLEEEDEAVAYPEEIDGLRLRSPDDFPHYMRTLEPNLGNVAFARKVLIVEGPHDLLAYRTAFERYVRFGLRNIAVVAAWGKDSLLSLV